MGLTDYRIKVGTRLRLFHVNMLKKYMEREPMTCATMAILECGDCPELDMEEQPVAEQKETHQYVVLAPELEGRHSAQLRDLVHEFGDIFSDLPGITNLDEHAIMLTTTKPIRRKPYPVPFSKVG